MRYRESDRAQTSENRQQNVILHKLSIYLFLVVYSTDLYRQTFAPGSVALQQSIARPRN